MVDEDAYAHFKKKKKSAFFGLEWFLFHKKWDFICNNSMMLEAWKQAWILMKLNLWIF